MTAVIHILSAPGGDLEEIVVCAKCEAGDPDLAALPRGSARAAVLLRARGGRVHP